MKNLNTPLDDKVFTQLKVFCAKRGVQIKEVIGDLLLHGMAAYDEPQKGSDE